MVSIEFVLNPMLFRTISGEKGNQTTKYRDTVYSELRKIETTVQIRKNLHKVRIRHTFLR